VNVGAGDDAEAEAVVVVEVLLAVERAAGTNVADGFGVQNAFLHRAAERRAMRVFGAEICVPGIQVRVKVQHGNGATGALRGGAEQRQGNGVVAANGDQLGAGGGQVERVLLNGLNGLIDIERVHGHVAGIRH